MKKSILSSFVALMITSATYAQVNIDKPINLNGGTGQRSITNLEAPVNGTDAVNKDYVDAKVAAGGGSLTMVSNESATTMSFGAAVRYCKNLNESSFTDWKLPSNQELINLISKGGASISSDASTNYIWVNDLLGYETGVCGVWGRGRVRLSDGNSEIVCPTSTTTTRIRCVR